MLQRPERLSLLQKLQRRIASLRNLAISPRSNGVSRYRGAILVEFAFSIPTLLAVLYYVLDYPKYEQLKAKARNSAHMAVNMIQNISKHRADRRITRNDLKRIAYAAYMNYYGTNAFYCGSDSRYPLGHIPDLTIVYIQGIEGNKVKILWSCETWTGAGTSPDTFSCSVYSSKTAWDDLLGIPEYNTEIPREQVKQEFTIEKDEYKILLIASCYTNSSAYKFKDGQKVSDDTKRLFGFYLLSFKINKEIVYNYMFQGRIVFTTDPGLFSDTPPQ